MPNETPFGAESSKFFHLKPGMSPPGDISEGFQALQGISPCQSEDTDNDQVERHDVIEQARDDENQDTGNQGNKRGQAELEIHDDSFVNGSGTMHEKGSANSLLD